MLAKGLREQSYAVDVVHGSVTAATRLAEADYDIIVRSQFDEELIKAPFTAGSFVLRQADGLRNATVSRLRSGGQ
jgi:hypothetical protein